MGQRYGRAMFQDKSERCINMPQSTDPLDSLDDEVAAAAFRRLVRHLRHRHDAQNIELMGLAGFCRNCLADWIRDAGYEGDKAAARELIHGMPQDEWKATRQTPATQEQLDRMNASVAKNRSDPA
tara:strand:- start:150 stop:524 length:375 start_codon:yes stop_codon:yes gene_type:complete